MVFQSGEKAYSKNKFEHMRRAELVSINSLTLPATDDGRVVINLIARLPPCIS